MADVVSPEEGELFYLYLRRLLILEGISCTQLSERTGISRETMYPWLVGECLPLRRETAQTVANCLPGADKAGFLELWDQEKIPCNSWRFQLPDCGTTAGYNRHRINRERPCDACYAANYGDKPRRVTNPCGTEAAYQRHRRRKEPVCDLCMEVIRPENRPRKQRSVKPIEHGTIQGARLHANRGEPVCDSCQAARREEYGVKYAGRQSSGTQYPEVRKVGSTYSYVLRVRGLRGFKSGFATAESAHAARMKDLATIPRASRGRPRKTA